jgi:hypothetical protein
MRHEMYANRSRHFHRIDHYRSALPSLFKDQFPSPHRNFSPNHIMCSSFLVNLQYIPRSESPEFRLLKAILIFLRVLILRMSREDWLARGDLEVLKADFALYGLGRRVLSLHTSVKVSFQSYCVVIGLRRSQTSQRDGKLRGYT